MKRSREEGHALERTPIFDLAVELSAVDPRDLKNLSYFGTRRVAALWRWTPQAAAVRPLTERLSVGLELGRRRLKEAKLRGGLWLGIAPQELAHKGVSRALAALPALLSAPQALGVGALGLRLGDAATEGLLCAQLEIAKRLRRPALYRLGTIAEQGAEGQREELALLLRCLASSGLPPRQLCVLHGGPQAVVTLQSLGLWACLDALDLAATLDHVRRYGARGLLLGSGLGFGQSDPLKTRRLLWRAMEEGISAELRWALAKGSAMQFVGV